MTLRVKLEIVPFGVEEKAREIGRLDIFNKGHGSNGMCKYGVIEMDEHGGGLLDVDVGHFRTEGAWTLVRLVLETLKELKCT